MSLNKTLDRLFDEIRREAKRNPDFANRLDAVLRLHDSRRDVPEAVTAELALAPAPAAEAAQAKRPPKAEPALSPAPVNGPAKAPPISPVGLYKRAGEEALRAALAAQELSALRALVAEHNLDPSGVTSTLTRDELAAHVIAHARARAERDEKMFDY